MGECEKRLPHASGRECLEIDIAIGGRFHYLTEITPNAIGWHLLRRAAATVKGKVVSSAVDSTIKLACTGVAHKARAALSGLSGRQHGAAGAAFAHPERPTLGSVRSFCASGNANVPYIFTQRACNANEHMTHATSRLDMSAHVIEPRICSGSTVYRSNRKRGLRTSTHTKCYTPRRTAPPTACQHTSLPSFLPLLTCLCAPGPLSS